MRGLAPPASVPVGRAVVGTLRRRLLVNAVVDPDEAAARLPAGVRPHVSRLGTVVGCCLLEIGDLRPARLPSTAGIPMRAAAHRISAEWDDGTGSRVVGVYVPWRCAASRLAVALGGRWFPGVHRRARIDVGEGTAGLSWAIQDSAGPCIAVRVRPRVDQPPAPRRDPVGTVCLGASIGVSPDRAGRLEGVRMEPDHRMAREVVVETLDSVFVSGFSTAQPATAFLMEDAAVTWTPAPAPGHAGRRSA